MAFTKDEVQTILFDAVAKAVKVDVSTLTPETRWVEDLGFKSVHGMKVAGFVNFKLGITLKLADLIKCDTLADAVDMLYAQVS